MIDLDTLLYGKPAWEEVVEFFNKGEFYEEHYNVAAIKKYLITAEQKKEMCNNDISIEDILNGRCSNTQLFEKIIKEWDAKIGGGVFHF